MQTRASILEAGHRVYGERGYYATRVDDVVRVAGVSHGVFYRYFRNKDELFRLLALQASDRFTAACEELGELDPGAADAREVFRAWLADYARRCGESAAIMRVWVDAITRDPQLGSDSAHVVRAGCRAVLPLLERRGQGDAEPEAVVMQVLLEEMTSGVPSARRIAGVGAVIERSLLFMD
jgi:AcrR family transcriptional regulator